MNTPELKVGQRFLAGENGTFVEYIVEEIAGESEYHRIRQTIPTPESPKWIELWRVNIAHVFPAPRDFLMPQYHDR